MADTSYLGNLAAALSGGPNFQNTSNFGALTPQAIAQQRAYGASLMQQQPVHRWTQGLANIVSSLVGGNAMHQADLMQAQAVNQNAAQLGAASQGATAAGQAQPTPPPSSAGNISGQAPTTPEYMGDGYVSPGEAARTGKPIAYAGQDDDGSAAPAQTSTAPTASFTSSGALPTFAASQGTPTGAGSNAQQALAFYQSKGLNPLGAAALVGGFTSESGAGLNTRATNVGDGNDGSNSVGIAQWNGARAQGLQQYARANGLDPSDINTQLQYSWQELNGPERATLAALQSAQNPTQATAAALGYERPAGWTADNPYGAKTFGSRLQATANLANSFGTPFNGQPIGPGPSRFAPVGASASPLPTMVASGMGLDLPPAGSFAPRPPAAPQGGAMAYSSTGQPVPVDANGNSVGPDGRPAALALSAQPSMAGTPAQRAISTLLGRNPQGAPQAPAGASAFSPQPGRATLPPTAFAAPGMGMLSPVPSGSVPQGAPNASAAQLYGQILANPFLSEADKAPIRARAFPEYNFAETPMGAIVRTNQATGAVAPAYQGGLPAQFTTGEGGMIFNTRTGLGPAGGAPAAAIRPMSPAERQAYGVPDGLPATIDAAGRPNIIPTPANAGADAAAHLDADAIQQSRNTLESTRQAGYNLGAMANAINQYGGKLPTGPLGTESIWARQLANQFGIGDPGQLSNLEQFAKYATGYAGQQVRTITSNPSSFDLQTTLKANPGPDMSDLTNRVLVDHLGRVNAMQQQYELAKQDYYANHNYSLTGFQQAWNRSTSGAGAIPLSRYPVAIATKGGTTLAKVPSTDPSGFSWVRQGSL